MQITPTTFNTGAFFYRPYQSDAITLRSMLSTNNGFGPHDIDQRLRELKYPGNSLMKRMNHLVSSELKHPISPKVNLPRLDTRQCPKCAANYYHSDLFNLPWLGQCPIHHCEFTGSCPKCSQPWPSNDEVSKRSCALCGLFDVTKIALSVSWMQKDRRYLAIDDLVSSITDVACAEAQLVNQDPLENCWWRPITTSHHQFPACGLNAHPKMTKERINYFGTGMPSFERKIIPLVSQELTHQQPERGASQPEDQCRALDQYEVIVRILKRFTQLTAEPHMPTISTYRHLTIEHLHKKTCPCAQCMALSLWFFYIASWEYGHRSLLGIQEYPFARNILSKQFYTPFHCTHISTDSHNLRVDQSFTSWTYQRSLELSFIDIYHFVIHVQRVIKSGAKSNNYRQLTPYIQSKKQLEDHYYRVNYTGGDASIYYQNRYPIDHLDVERAAPTSDCSGRYERLESMMDKEIRFSYRIDLDQFCYADYMQVRSCFDDYINRPYPRYSRGSSPVRDVLL